MSVTAHRVTEFRFEHSGFELRHNEKLAAFLEKEDHLSFNLNPYGSGLFDLPIETLERAIAIADQLDLDKDTVGVLQEDIAAARSTHKEYVTYYCC